MSSSPRGQILDSTFRIGHCHYLYFEYLKIQYWCISLCSLGTVRVLLEAAVLFTYRSDNGSHDKNMIINGSLKMLLEQKNLGAEK